MSPVLSRDNPSTLTFILFRRHHFHYQPNIAMAAFIGGLRRAWLIVSPPTPAKHEDALKFGILGAANITYVTYL